MKLDPAFRAVVRGAYHVFLTPEGDCRGLYVARKGPSGFEVRELQGGRASVRFSYRIVARRRDVVARRFARVQLPKLPSRADALIQAPEATGLPTQEEARKRAGGRLRRKAARVALAAYSFCPLPG